MKRAVNLFLVITAIYIVVSVWRIGWWALLFGPISAFIAIFAVLIAPGVHHMLFGSEFYRIRPGWRMKGRDDEKE